MAGSNHRCIPCVLLDRLRNGLFPFTVGSRGSTGVCERFALEKSWVWRNLASRLVRQSRIRVVLNMLLEFSNCSWCGIYRLEPRNWFHIFCNIGTRGAASNTSDFCFDFFSVSYGKRAVMVSNRKTIGVQASNWHGAVQSLNVASEGGILNSHIVLAKDTEQPNNGFHGTSALTRRRP